MGQRADEVGSPPSIAVALMGVAIAVGLHLRRSLGSVRGAATTGGRAGHDGRDPHGRHAGSPEQIPRRGWRDILLRLKDRVSRDNLTIVAGGVAFFAFLAIPSTLTALVSLYGLEFDPGDVERQVASMRGVMPAEAIKLISDQLQSLTSNPSSKLSASFVISLLIALWSTRSSMSAMMTGINIAYGEEEKRGLITFQLSALGLTLGALLFAIIALVLVAVLPAVIDLLPLGSAGKMIAAIVRWPVLVVLLAVGLAVLYRFAPCRGQPKWRWVSWGAALATVLWILSSALFSVYVGHFAAYDKTYGSLGAVVVLLMWLFVTTLVVLLGAELNAEMEHQTMRDSTRGPQKPLGQRGAVMADTVGQER